MQTASVSTQAADPYRAGLQLGKKLYKHSPEVVFLFTTVHYCTSTELLEGLYDGLGDDAVIVLGGTGDGYYESSEIGEVGASALGLNSGGQVSWQLFYQEGVIESPQITTRGVLDQARQANGDSRPSFMFLLCDSRTDATEVEKVIEHETDIPVCGGMVAVGTEGQPCTLFANRRLLNDAAVMLTATGPIKFEIHIDHSLTAVGQPGLVSEVDGTIIKSIDGLAAMEFVERETGKPVLPSDSGLTSLTFSEAHQPELNRVRSILPETPTGSGSFRVYGGVAAGKQVQVCLGEPDTIILGIKKMVARTKDVSFTPEAAIIVSCAGRKWLLGDQIGEEVRALTDQYDDKLPMVGFPSQGEIGPLTNTDGSYAPNLFHNMTFVLLLIGS